MDDPGELSAHDLRMMALAERVQALGEARLEGCMEAMDDDTVESPGLAPFCGCTTCVVREVIDAIWDEMLAAGRLGRLRAVP